MTACEIHIVNKFTQLACKESSETIQLAIGPQLVKSYY